MPMKRISLAWITVIIAVMSFALGCLANASAPWAKLALVAYYGSLGMAPFGIVYRNGRIRAFYLGYAFWGWLFLSLSFGSVEKKSANYLEKIIDWLYPRMIIKDRQWIT